MRKLKTGVITKRDRKMSRLLAEQLEASYRQKVVCKICGHPDNDWPDRHGICSDCFCRWLNGKFAQGLKLADAMKMVNELDDPEIIKDLQRSRQKSQINPEKEDQK